MNRIFNVIIAVASLGIIASSALADTKTNKQTAIGLLQEGLVKGNRDYIKTHVIEKYRQHNPQAADGRKGLLEFVEFLKTINPPAKVNPVRVIADDDFVVVHQQAELFGPKIIIDLFRFEDGKIVEHWDAIQKEETKTASGRSMIDGATKITDLDKTAENKSLVKAFVSDVLMKGKLEKIDSYIHVDYQQHNPFVQDTREGLKGFINYLGKNNISFAYTKLHNVVADGNFVFTQSEGQFDKKHTAFYDLWRVENGMIVEHWDAVQEVPAKFAHSNGMF